MESDSKKPRLDQSAEEMLGIPELHSGSLLIPGKYRFCSPKIVRKSLSTISKLALYPVTLAPSYTVKTLEEALLQCPSVSEQKECQDSSSTDVKEGAEAMKEDNSGRTSVKGKELSFSNMYKRIRAVCCDEDMRAAIPLSSLFHDDFCDHIETMGFVDFLSEKLLNIVELVKRIDIEWEYSQREQKEDVDHSLMSEITSMLLGNGSVVYDECVIDCQELPHGVIDIVGGKIENRKVNVSIGVLIESVGRFILHDPTGISAKTRETLYTTSLSSQAVIESLAFSEVVQVQESTGKPNIFLAATRESFRPLIRIKKHDLLFTTKHTVRWWDCKEKKAEMDGIVLLAILILYLSECEMWSTDPLDKAVLDPEFILCRSNWNEVYQKSTTKYPDTIKPQKSSKPSQYSRRNNDGIQTMDDSCLLFWKRKR